MTNAENISMNDMTRKEAIELLDNLIGMVSDNHGADYDRALHMAINSLKVDEAYQLEYERTTKNDLGVDAISRQAVLDLINADWKYENLEIEINNLPPVTPQEPRWIPVKDPVNELPTEKPIWVTIRGERFLSVDHIYYMKTALDKLFVEDVIAYMDYVKPEPYQPVLKENEDGNVD